MEILRFLHICGTVRFGDRFGKFRLQEPNDGG